MKLTVGSIVQLTNIGAMTERPVTPLDSGMECTVCHGTGKVRVLRAGNIPDFADCPNCRGTGTEINKDHMDDGCVPAGSDYGPGRGIQPPTKDIKG